MARDRGLAPLAKVIFEQRSNNIETLAARYISDDVPTIEDALKGARDIIAEEITEDEKARRRVRTHFRRDAVITSKVARGKDEAGIKYKDYFGLF